ncbi:MULTISPECIES: Scr1 family TA system antitoxin-like transcriptional regulator [Streptomyces]|uniref:Helix-turn-helix domain-containing protein n=1 Tax=Streptomyces misionensis TaxID=67331 RepID=A0A1H4ZQ62_9ACTN|nr:MULTISPECIES: Scr1 family TA system antitoxin-like transcriptional regulator [Streptomyces]SED32316.1 Helix-turn-helix domain-containing protein [Streptomyces misionensis]SFY47840.1 hypothetical protein STEPF1_01053 [Streptomyces sp. F-1]
MSDWDAELEDAEAGAVIRTVARQLKLWREAAGLTQPEFGALIGYGEELVSSVERRRRIPRPEYLDLQVLPLSREENSGLDGPFRLLSLKNGTTVGHTEVLHISRVIAEPKEVQVLNIQYGIIRAQALSPQESMALIEKVLGET